MPFNVERVEAAIFADQDFLEAVPEGLPRTMLKYFIAELQSVIGDLADQIVTVESLVRTKLTVSRYRLQTNFAARFMETLRSASPQNSGRKSALAAIERATRRDTKAVEQYEAILEGQPNSLKGDLSDEQFLVRPYGGGFAKELLSEWRQGNMTIGQLFEKSPNSILLYV